MKKVKKVHTLGDAPIEPEYIAQMNSLAQVVQELFNGKGTRVQDSKVGFVLMVFALNDKSRANYISNANRQDVIVLLKEQLARFEGMPEQKGRA